MTQEYQQASLDSPRILKILKSTCNLPQRKWQGIIEQLYRAAFEPQKEYKNTV